MVYYLFYIASKVKYSYLFLLWSFFLVVFSNSAFTIGAVDKTLVVLSRLFYHCLVFLIIILFPFNMIKRKKISLWMNKYIILIFLYIGSAVFSIIINFRSVEMNSAIFNLIAMVRPAMISVMALQTMTRDDIEKVFYSFFLFALFNSVLGLIHGFVYGPFWEKDHSAIFADRNLYARFLIIVFSFLLAQYLKKLPVKKISWELIFIIFFFLVITIQLSRAGYLLLLVAIFYIVFNNNNKKLKYFLLLLSMLIIPVFSYMILLRIDTEKMNVVNYSDLGRAALLKAGLNMIVSKPVFGIGYGMSKSSFKDYMDKSLPGIDNLTTIHNCYVNVFAEQGIIGLIIFLTLNFGILIKQRKIIINNSFEKTYLNVACSSSLLIFLIHGLVYHPFDYEGSYWMVICLNIISMIHNEPSKI